MPTILRLLCLLTLPAAMLPAAAQQAAVAAEAERSHCFGRFCISLPAGFVRVRDEHELDGVRIEEKRWHNPLNKERGQEFDARLKAGIARYGPVSERITLDQPAMQVGVFQRPDNPFIATLGALAARGPVDVWLQADADVLAPREALPRLSSAARSYRVAELNPDSMRDAGLFHLRFGALALPYLPARAPESADVHFEYPALKLKLSIHTATVNDAKPQSLLERIGKGAAAPLGRDAAIQKAQTRFAAGMVGDELVTRTDLNGGTLLYKWTYAGDQRNELKPRVTLQMESTPERAAEKLAVWNSLLASFRSAASSAVRH